jgi:hypothetical protein
VKNRTFRPVDNHARRRRRGTARLFVLGAAFVVSATDEIYGSNGNNDGGRYNPGFRRTALLATDLEF